MTYKYVNEVQVGEKIIVEQVKTVIKVEVIRQSPNNNHFQTMVTFSDGTCEVYEQNDTVSVKTKQNAQDKVINSVGDLIEALQSLNKKHKYVYVQDRGHGFSLGNAQVVESPIFVVVRQEL
jgi:flagellar biosynthesis/type III secretory pathway ATPase